MARFARDLVRMTAEIMAERFDPMRLVETANLMPREPEKLAETIAAVELLRDERLRSFRIDIETDSTIEPDENAEKQRRTEFVTAVGGFMREAMPLAATAPALAPVMSETLLFLVRGYRAGRMMEDTIEKAAEQMQQQAQQAQQQPQADPAAAADAAKAQGEQQRLVMDRERHGVEIEAKQAELAHKQAMAGLDQEMKRREMDKFDREMKGEQEMKAEEITLIVQPLSEAMAQLGQMLMQMQQAQQQLVQLIAAPKRAEVIRGPDGRVMGADIGIVQQTLN
jgi:hypothetical protein